MTIEELKKTYNVVIAREIKAEKFLEDRNISQAKKESWLPEFENITIQLSLLMREYKSLVGEEMPIKNILGGFENV